MAGGFGRAQPVALSMARRELAETIAQVRFAQFLLCRQGGRLKEYANSKGVRLIGDLPFYVAGDSCEVWTDPALFRLDERHRARFVGGVPPDYFSALGSSGVILSMTGTRCELRATAGASIASVRCSRMST